MERDRFSALKLKAEINVAAHGVDQPSWSVTGDSTKDAHIPEEKVLLEKRPPSKVDADAVTGARRWRLMQSDVAA